MANELVEAQNNSSLLGLRLGLPPHEVEKICGMYSDPMKQLTQVIISFTRSADPKPTWGLIVSALESPMIKLTALANRIKAKYLPSCSSLDSSTSSTTTGMYVSIECIYLVHMYIPFLLLQLKAAESASQNRVPKNQLRSHF